MNKLQQKTNLNFQKIQQRVRIQNIEMDQKEPFSRVIIDRKLREVGWDIEDSRQVIFEDHGNAGRADYVLKDTSGKPIAIIEAKAPNIDPYSAKNQASNYV